jgi:hypothetical protein
MYSNVIIIFLNIYIMLLLCKICHKTWIQPIHYYELDLPHLICSRCKNKMKKRDMNLYYEWIGFKWKAMIALDNR